MPEPELFFIKLDFIMTRQLNTAGTGARMVGWEERREREREKKDKRSDCVREGRKDDQCYAEIIIIKHKQEGV